jgi:hypothetical protein
MTVAMRVEHFKLSSCTMFWRRKKLHEKTCKLIVMSQTAGTLAFTL